MTTKTVYVCVFRIKGMLNSVESERGIAFFYDGFWVNRKLEICPASESEIWIPPNAIDHIYKEVRRVI